MENINSLPTLEDYPENPEMSDASLKILVDGRQISICHMGFKYDSYINWCGHQCSYCYSRGISTRYGRWEHKKIKIANIDKLKKHFENVFKSDKTKYNKIESCIEHKYPIRLGTNSDCFQLAEKKYKITYRFIDEILNLYNYPYTICSKNKMVADPEYMDLYKNRDNVNFQFTLSTMDQDYLDKIERGASTAEERVSTIEKLSKAGYFVGCRLSPYNPVHLSDVEYLLKRLADAGCKHVITELLRVTPSLNKIMIKECGIDVISEYKKLGSPKPTTNYYRYPLLENIEEQRKISIICKKLGMSFATCGGEDPSFNTVDNCCGFDGIKMFEGCPTATSDTAFKLCKEHGSISFDEFIKDNWCPDVKKLKEDWDSGYYENVLMNFEFCSKTKRYKFVEVNQSIAKINSIQTSKLNDIF